MRKYRNNKTVIRTSQGNMKFDSIREATRYVELKQLEKTKQIKDLQCQVKYQLIPTQKRPDGKTERSVSYIADFVYSDGNNTVVEDTKGFKTKDYIIKRKLMLYVHGIAVKEV